MIVQIQPPARIGGTVSAPPSKSMAHRAVLCSALAKGTSHIENLEFSKDISATLAAAGQLCARVESGPADVLVEGLGHFRPVFGPVDCCESGSTLRFLIPLASLTGQSITFVGRGRLMERPQSVYETLYREQNLHFEQANGQLTVAGSLRSGEYTLAGNVSSQFISGLLFALPLLAGDSTLHLIPPVESRSYIEMTRAAQAAFGVTSHWLDDATLCIPGGQQYHPRDYIVEGDYSQAAFLAVLGAVKGGITLTGLAAETLQGDAAILDILRRCGAKFTRTEAGLVFEQAPLHGVDIDLADCPDLGPVLMVLGLLCEGTTVIRNAERLRIKESDRIAAMEAELRACGGVLSSEGGTITVQGCKPRLHAPEAPLSGHNDHRVVMSLTVLALAADIPLAINEAEAVQKSWPHFFDALKPLGVEVHYAG
ncbi:3-phosphoshikimate 1-carboxyvinyltransferase [Faecalibacterium sp. OF04-11AC]|uniref:3-phosphoshikimate 1-carboxyvinyltransferase n=1 Tax=Faecalibacterium sp. OF04-11AC TaxID=2293109 RepID=UPI000E8D68A7|nr:3-phosphoshikimate 1-carboxyvinyltransferase [Faecalibacterium sp. OF04-11AC]RGF74442.1 3-phosphoshikimate 1-carboxyvinyltransferase [Faecalibacterium sp. OF04-11AC]